MQGRYSRNQFRDQMSREDRNYNRYHRDADKFLPEFVSNFELYQQGWYCRPSRENTDTLNAIIRFLGDFGYDRGPLVNALIY